MKKHVFLIILLALLGLGTLSSLGRATQAKTPEKNLSTAACTVSYDKTADPTIVDAGGVVTVAYSLQAIGDCSSSNSTIDAMLVMDRSGSMGGQKITDAKQAAIGFVNWMDLSTDQVGVASFASTVQGTLDHKLSQNAISVNQAINDLDATGQTNIQEGLEIAKAEIIASGRHIAANAPIIIILSDGKHNETSSGELLDTANRIKGEGIRIISIGLGSNVDESQLKAIASSDHDYYYAPSSADLEDIYNNIAGTVRVAARDMVITDTLSSYVSLVPSSVQGPISPTVSGDQIIWQSIAVSTHTLRLTYQVVMTDTPNMDPGWPTDDDAIAAYIDADGNPASITFPTPYVKVRDQCGQPTLCGVCPTWGCVDDDVPVCLIGGGFVDPSASIGGQALNIHLANQHIIQATLGAGLGAGVYDVSVVNQCALTATLPAAFTLYSRPHILAIRPPEGYQDAPTELTICGEGLAPGVKAYIQVGINRIELGNQATYGESCLVGTVPEGIEAGEHTIIVESPCGTATGAYRVLAETLNDDLWGRSEGLWTDPAICPRESEDINVGLFVHRRGGKIPLENVTVRFYEGDPQQPGAVLIGDGVIPEMPERVTPYERIHGTSTSAVPWTPSQGVMGYTLYAVIDPDDQVLEDIEGNNVVSRTVQVLPSIPGIDLVAPHVDEFQINSGADTVFDQQVDLHVQATDFAQPGSTPSGMDQFKIVELLFNEAAGYWVPVRASGWQTFSEDSTWTLHPQNGLHFLQAWASDKAGNVSRYAYQQRVNYSHSCTPVARDGVQVYRQDVAAGDTIYAELISCQGDADLYIWPPDWPGRGPWVSNQTGSATEVLSFTAPISGEYQIEVYGYTAAEYSIQIEVQPGSVLPWANSRSVAGSKDNNPTRTSPAVPPSSVPRTDLMSGAPPEPPQVHPVYLPLVVMGH